MKCNGNRCLWCGNYDLDAVFLIEVNDFLCQKCLKEYKEGTFKITGVGYDKFKRIKNEN